MGMIMLKREMIEDMAIVGGLIGVQFVYAGNSVLLSYLMSTGLNPLSLITFSAFATFLVLSPISIFFERKHWPKKLSFKLMIRLILISFTGVTLFQSLMLKGIELTSPAMATAMPNLGPALIFAIAWVFRLEKVKLSCLYSKMKIVGTMLCVVGAITMGLMQSTAVAPVPPQPQPQTQTPTPDLSDTRGVGEVVIFDDGKITGCLFLMAAVFVLSSNIVLQAQTLGEFPAPITLCAITSLIGMFITGIVEVGLHKFETGWPILSIGPLIGYSLLVGTVSGTCVSFNGWAIKKRGPVLVSMFSPVSTVVSAVFSAINLGDTIKLGSLGGMLLMFTGLYVVLWAKGKEGYSTTDGMEIDSDTIRKPLLC